MGLGGELLAVDHEAAEELLQEGLQLLRRVLEAGRQEVHQLRRVVLHEVVHARLEDGVEHLEACGSFFFGSKNNNHEKMATLIGREEAQIV